MTDGHGDCGGGGFCFSGGGDSGSAAGDGGNPLQPDPIDERPKINGAPVIDQSHEFLMEKKESHE